MSVWQRHLPGSALICHDWEEALRIAFYNDFAPFTPL
jgi:hypothetical protein